ncbi:hypothetical protein FBU30_007897 [Linnemannia zychae]|nr:hypothetical protein FBU30_007897 [Linnemannia zychae]
MRTNRHIYEILRPNFYKDLNLQYFLRAKDLWKSPEALRALARNIHFVDIVDLGYDFVIYYGHAIRAFSLNVNHIATSAESTLPIDFSVLSVQPASKRKGCSIELVPLPPMINLTEARISLFERHEWKDNPFFAMSNRDSYAAIVRLDRVIYGCLNLRKLRLCNTGIEDVRCAQILSSTLLSLVNLRQLKLDLYIYENGEEIILPICFSFPSLIESCELLVYNMNTYKAQLAEKALSKLHGDHMDYYDNELDGSSQSITRGWARRDTPLDCPNLEKISFSKLQLNKAETNMVEIGNICPNISDISHTGRPEYSDDKLWVLNVTRALPKNRLERFCFESQLYIGWDCDLLRESLLRHSEKLREIVIHTRVTSAGQRMLLESCKGLVKFGVHTSIMYLSDASAAVWASSSFTHLEMNINITLPSSPNTEYMPYYYQTQGIAIPDEERHIFKQLERLYQSIGKQTNLGHLHLGRTNIPQHWGAIHGKKDLAMPGMLKLDDGDSDRPGFLDLLSGLNKLRFISGSVFAETQNALIPKDSKEIIMGKIGCPGTFGGWM